MNALPQAVAALTQLSLLGAVMFLQYTAMILSNFLMYNGTSLCKPVMYLMMTIMKELSLLIWVTIVLFTFKVKADSKL